MSTYLKNLRANEDPLLTGFAQGYTNEALIGEQIFKRITLPKSKAKYPKFGKEHLKVHDASRAIGGEAKTIQRDDFEYGTVETVEKSLKMALDYREADEARGFVELEKYHSTILTGSLEIGKEKEIADLVATSGSYASGHVDALSGSDCWDHADSDPIQQIRDAKQTVRSKAIIEPNTLVLGEDSYLALQEHPDFVEYLKYTQVPIVTPEVLKKFFQIDNILIGKSVYYDVATGTMVDVWNDMAALLIIAGNQAPSKYDLSFGYNFVLENFPYISRYKSLDQKVTFVEATACYKPQVVFNSGGFLFTNTKGS